ncbi:MAG TPA: autotransporter outer membrane beta-barrel domain-containing protein [Reyranella sp.]
MRFVARGLLAAAAVTGVWFATPNQAQADSAGCTAVNGFNVSFAAQAAVSTNSPSGSFAAGDTVTVTLTLGAGIFPTDFGIIPPGGVVFDIIGNPNTTTTVVYTFPAAATGAFQINSSGPTESPGTLSFSCGSSGSGRVGAAQQNATNAQVATANGQQVLQQTSDAIKLGVLSSFAAGNTSQTAQAGLDAYTRLAKLENERADLERELADRPVAPNDPERRALENRLALTDRNLDLARGGLQSRTMSVAAAPDGSTGGGSTGGGSTDDQRKAAGPSGSFHVSSSALADFCGTECGPPDPSTTRWNGWFDGRLIGATDSIAQQSAFGFVGVAGVDYKIAPWLALGLTVGTEAFNTKIGTAGANVSENGVSVAPYLGVRLDPNIFFSAFVGGTWLNYNTAPQPGTSGAFGAWRFMTGGSLTGVWRFGPWRLQPSIDIAYGSESQNGFTDSAGTLVPGQIVQYGRVRGGPEVGYRFDFPDWSLEPFLLARGNLDFATNETVLANGQQVAIRGGGSGGAGAGFVVQGRGFNVRGDFVYDSIGVTGLDIWTGRLRAGWSF